MISLRTLLVFLLVWECVIKTWAFWAALAGLVGLGFGASWLCSEGVNFP